MDNLLEYLSLSLDFIGICIAPIFAIIGVIMGATLSYFWQSRLNKHQREWDLDNQRREQRRSQLSDLATILNDYVGNEITRLNNYWSVLKIPSKIGSAVSDMGEYTKKSNEMHSRMMAELDFSIDSVLNNLWNVDWQKAFIMLVQAYSPRSTDEQVNGAVVLASNVNKKIQRRINELKDQTYNPDFYDE